MRFTRPLQMVVRWGSLATSVFNDLATIMPATPLWIHRLADALPTLASLPQDLVDRRTLEEILGVGKWTAWRILKQCGAEEGPGTALVCRRDELVTRLRAVQQDGRLGPEIARRQRV